MPKGPKHFRRKRLPKLPFALATPMVRELLNAYSQASYVRLSLTGERVKPELIFFPVQGVLLRTSDFVVIGSLTHAFTYWRMGWFTRLRFKAALDLFASLRHD